MNDATHVEVGGKVYEFGDKIVEIVTKKEHPYGWLLGVWADGNFQYINENSFNILGIKPLREKKREPIEFEFIPSLEMVKDSWLGELIPMEAVGKKFKCVEILEEKK
jgi:hypothetical protein